MSAAKKRILIVDDDEDIADVLSVRIRSSGPYEVATAADGALGLAKAADFLPDLVLLDIMMPEMDGWEFCRRLKSDPELSETAVVVMTAYAAPDLEQRLRASGASGLLRKPFTLAQIAEILSALEQQLPRAAAPSNP